MAFGLMVLVRLRSLDEFTSESITPDPEWTFGTFLPSGIVDPFLMRAPHYSLSQRDTSHTVFPQIRNSVVEDFYILTNVRTVTKPTLQMLGFSICLWNHTDGQFRGKFVRRPVERYRSYRITTRPLLASLPQPFSVPSFL